MRSVGSILESAAEGGRISLEEAVLLFEEADLFDLASCADSIRRLRHPDNVISYIIDRNINYTNICKEFCTFCAFYRVKGDPEAYVLPDHVIHKKIEETIALGGTGILMQGGVHPDLKIDYYEWLMVHREAHHLGLRTTATMMIGVGETIHHRIRHFQRLRELQDETSGFTAFIPWTFQPENTELAERGVPEVTAAEYLRLLALSRIYLDNIENVQVSWLTVGLKVGQVGLRFGVNDMGSIMIEENVISAAGARNRANDAELRRIIRDAGFFPRQRTTLYERYVN